MVLVRQEQIKLEAVIQALVHHLGLLIRQEGQGEELVQMPCSLDIYQILIHMECMVYLKPLNHSLFLVYLVLEISSILD